MREKCPSCNKDTFVEVVENFDTHCLTKLGTPVVVNDVHSWKCSCGETWINSKELKKIRLEIDSQGATFDREYHERKMSTKSE